MNLLELNKKIKEKESNKQKVNKGVEDYKEIKKIIYEISIGKEKHNTNNKELIDKMEIKLTKAEITNSIYTPWIHNDLYNYSFKLNKTNISKIQKYIDEMEKENEK